MPAVDSRAITEQLCKWNCDEPQARENLLALVYDDLRAKAQQIVGRSDNPVFEPTVLVHELYLHFQTVQNFNWQNRQHFFAVVALSMRQIIADEVVRANALKRGGNRVRVTTQEFELENSEEGSWDLLDLNRALDTMDDLNPQSCRVVELHYFAGLTFNEIAVVLNTSERSVRRRWIWARTWLFRQLNAEA